MAITIDGTNGLSSDNAALKLDGTTLAVDETNNRVGVGTASPAVAMDVVGQVRASTGILFGSDTAAANALDDYEEGTWTPQLGTDATQPTVTYTSQNGRYTKIGNEVTVEGYVQWTPTTGGSGSVTIKNLPFNSNDYSPDSRGFSYIFGWNGVTFTGVLAGILQGNANYTLLYSNNNGSVGSLPLASVSSGGAFRFIFSYIVA